MIPFKIKIDFATQKRRYGITVDRKRVWLTPKSFKYFVILAIRAAEDQSEGWILKTTIEPGANQSRYVYRLRTEIAETLGRDWEPIENNRSGYYRLNVHRTIIKFKVARLRNHPDFEIRQLAGRIGREFQEDIKHEMSFDQTALG